MAANTTISDGVNPVAVRPLQLRKQELVRDAIWDAAIDLFARKGFDETTVDDIAEAAGTSRRTLFRYFESKSDLLAQPVVSFGTQLGEAIQSLPTSYSIQQAFREVVLRISRASISNPRTRQVMEIAAKCPAARDAQVARMAEVQDKVVEAFTRRYQNELNAVQTRLVASLTLSLIGVVCHCWFESGSEDIGATAEQVFTTLSDLICGSANTPQGKPVSKIGRSRK